MYDTPLPIRLCPIQCSWLPHAEVVNDVFLQQMTFEKTKAKILCSQFLHADMFGHHVSVADNVGKR